MLSKDNAAEEYRLVRVQIAEYLFSWGNETSGLIEHCFSGTRSLYIFVHF